MTTMTAQQAARPIRPVFPLRGWLGVWIAAGFVVLTTLVAFQIPIVGDLEAIDQSLTEASRAVGGAGGNVKSLPGYIADVNGKLEAIDAALKPVPASTRGIAGSLVAMRGDLQKVDGSLRATSGSLTTTAGALREVAGALSDTARALIGTSTSLVDTATVLKSLAASLADTGNVLHAVHDVGADILRVLRHTQSNPEGVGTENLWRRADETLKVRDDTEKDTAKIVVGISDVNRHLKSICDNTPPSPPAGPAC